MTTELAGIDGNGRNSLIAIANDGSGSIVYLYADPITHRLLVDVTGAVGYQQPTSGSVNGTNTTFVWATAPNVIVVDNVPKQKTSSDGTVNWTGTTTTVLTIAPNYDIFATN